MDQHITGYFFTLAGVSITFVGFTTIAIAFLQATGGTVSVVQFSLIRIFLTNGLAAAAFSLLPPLLDLLAWSPEVIWRLSSALLALYILSFVVAAFRGRRAVEGGRPPLYILANFTVSALNIVYLSLNVAGVFSEPNVGPYAVGATWLLTVSALIFVQNLRVFLPRPRDTNKS